MINVSFIYNGQINGYPSWIGYDGTTQLVILWNGLYWVMTGWPYDGEPRNYTNTLDPTTGWALYNSTTLTATFNVVLGACPLPTPTNTVTPTRTPTPTPTPGVTHTPTPTPTPSQVCNAPVLNNVTFIGHHASSYTFGLFYTPSSTCSDIIYEYSCDGSSWTSCGYDECGSGFGCISPIQITIDSIDLCVVCSGNWYFRLKQCCPNLQSGYSNTVVLVPPTPTPTPTISISKTPSRTPSITPTISITPTRTVTPTATKTPTPSVSSGLCRFLDSLSCNVKKGNYAKLQYTNCNGILQMFTVYLPSGLSVVDVSFLNICMRVGTPLTIITGSAFSVQPIFGDNCTVAASPSLTPTKTPTPTVTPSKTPSITPSTTPVNTCLTPCTLSDVTIGTQTWTGCNLSVTRYSDGTSIPQITDSKEWATTTVGAWCWYNNDPTSCYGKLYNWYAVAGIYDAASAANPALRKQLAPTGYHIPSYNEQFTLSNYLGGQSVAGGALKETGFTHWLAPNAGANNASGFTGLPGGYRSISLVTLTSSFGLLGNTGTWWTSTQRSSNFQTEAYNFWVFFNNPVLYVGGFQHKNYGQSVRCIKN